MDEKTLGFADFGSNRQYIKLWGNARVVDDDPALSDSLRDPSYPGKVERVILFEIEAWDLNCPQHIRKRFSQKQIAPVIEQLQGRMRNWKQNCGE